MRHLLILALLLGACSDAPRAALVVYADQDAEEVAALERGLHELAAGRDRGGSRLSARERGAAVRPEDGRVGPPVPRLRVRTRVAKDDQEAQAALTELAREGLAIAGSPRMAQLAGNTAVVAPGRVAVIGGQAEAGAAAAAWIAADQAGYLAGYLAAAASRKRVVGLVVTGAPDEEAFARAFQFGTTAHLSEETRVHVRYAAQRTREAAAEEVARLVALGADVVAVTGGGDAARGVILDATQRGLIVVLPDATLSGVAGPLLAGRVTVPWARLVHELASRHDAPAPVRIALKDGWTGADLGPVLAAREDVKVRFAEIVTGLTSGGLRTDRTAPGARVASAAADRVPLPEVQVPAQLPPPPPLRKHPTRTDFQPWDGKAR